MSRVRVSIKRQTPHTQYTHTHTHTHTHKQANTHTRAQPASQESDHTSSINLIRSNRSACDLVTHAHDFLYLTNKILTKHTGTHTETRTHNEYDNEGAQTECSQPPTHPRPLIKIPPPPPPGLTNLAASETLPSPPPPPPTTRPPRALLRN